MKVLMMREYAFYNDKQKQDYAHWDEYIVVDPKDQWWTSKAKWIWIKDRVVTDNGPNIVSDPMLPDILKYPAASGGKEEPIPPFFCFITGRYPASADRSDGSHTGVP